MTEDPSKKADIYINNHGVSLKQTGASFPYNRLQRSELLATFQYLDLSNPELTLDKIDSEVRDFHDGKIQDRSRPWQEFFSETDFLKLLRFLMLYGSPNLGISNYPAEFICEAPASRINESNIFVYTFEEYYYKYFSELKIAIRRQWIGQISNSEHTRALSIANKAGNEPWVFKDISALPRPRDGKLWRDDIPESDRREVYFLSIEKV